MTNLVNLIVVNGLKKTYDQVSCKTLVQDCQDSR